MAPGGVQYSVVVIVPERDGKDFAPSCDLLTRGYFAANRFVGRRIEKVVHELAINPSTFIGRTMQVTTPCQSAGAHLTCKECQIEMVTR